MLSLSECVGRNILIRAISVDENRPVFVKLLGIENGGIWLESQQKTNEILRFLERDSAPKTPVFFLPFSSIAWISYWMDIPSLSETALGIDGADQP
jgi:hypothetical protein